MGRKNRVWRVATQVRRKLEEGSVNHEQLKKLYASYADVPRVPLFLIRAQKLFPSLNCGLASVLLRHELKEGEVVNGKYGLENHTFLLLYGDTVVDVTADQYGGPAVYVGMLREPWTLS